MEVVTVDVDVVVVERMVEVVLVVVEVVDSGVDWVGGIVVSDVVKEVDG